MRLSPLVGYLVAGIIAGPFTPGFVGDQELAPQLAEIGVILLMFGVGLHFSIRDLMAVKHIAIPGAVVQISVATLLGWGLAALMGWPTLQGIVFGFSLATASTVVLLRSYSRISGLISLEIETGSAGLSRTSQAFSARSCTGLT